MNSYKYCTGVVGGFEIDAAEKLTVTTYSSNSPHFMDTRRYSVVLLGEIYQVHNLPSRFFKINFSFFFATFQVVYFVPFFLIKRHPRQEKILRTALKCRFKPKLKQHSLQSTCKKGGRIFGILGPFY